MKKQTIRKIHDKLKNLLYKWNEKLDEFLIEKRNNISKYAIVEIYMPHYLVRVVKDKTISAVTLCI